MRVDVSSIFRSSSVLFLLWFYAKTKLMSLLVFVPKDLLQLCLFSFLFSSKQWTKMKLSHITV